VLESSNCTLFAILIGQRRVAVSRAIISSGKLGFVRSVCAFPVKYLKEAQARGCTDRKRSFEEIQPRASQQPHMEQQGKASKGREGLLLRKARKQKPSAPTEEQTLDRDLLDLLKDPPRGETVPVTEEEALRRNRTLLQLNYSFRALSGKTKKKNKRVVETAEAKQQREEMLYESVIRIFEIQLKMEKLEKEARRRRGDTPLSSAPSPSPLRAPRPADQQTSTASSFFLPRVSLPSLFSSRSSAP